ncbi:MAG: GIY-YIG nuclease family protein [Planctomycetes bacterium]|nr:GIY-YIG nuclease family protein [Planctomycetota bacterium]
MRPFYVYILRCSDGSYYTGHTDDLAARLAKPSSGLWDGYTAQRRPVTLVYSEHFQTRLEAQTVEFKIKGWSRAKKEALIRGDWGRIHELARCRTRPSTRAANDAALAQGGRRESPSTLSGAEPPESRVEGSGRAGEVPGGLLTCALSAILILSGCRGGGEASRDSARAPARPAGTAVPTPPITSASAPAAIWDLEYLTALCPACQATLDYRAAFCGRCKRECRWVPPEVPNTPEGAFIALKLAALYDDVEFYRLALLEEDAARFERSIRLGGPAPLGSREQAVETRVKNVVAGADSAILRIEYRGRMTELSARPEKGRWKIALTQTESTARVSLAREFMQGLDLAIVRYMTERGSPPASGNAGLVAALTLPASSGQPYYWLTQTSLGGKGELLDPWGRPVAYVTPAPESVAGGTDGEPPAGAATIRKYSLYSVGPNGIDEQGAGDDIGP